MNVVLVPTALVGCPRRDLKMVHRSIPRPLTRRRRGTARRSVLTLVVAAAMAVALGSTTGSDATTQEVTQVISPTVSPTTRDTRDASPPDVHFVVNAASPGRRISPLIYGINANAYPRPSGPVGWPQTESEGVQQILERIRPGLVRLGGNAYTAFNWENGDANHGSDYNFANYPLVPDGGEPGNRQHDPAGALTPTIESAARVGAATMVTIPIVDQVAADALHQDDDVRESGPGYLDSRFRRNLPTGGGRLVGPPNTGDTVVYQDQLVAYLQRAEPSADILYSLDNEPNDWSYTHAEVHPEDITYDELVARNLSYAAAIKAVDPDAVVSGPALDGWQGQEDAVTGGDPPSEDFRRHGRFLDYYLDRLHAADQAAGRRLVDLLDVHWYPQVAAGIFSTGHSPDMVDAREQAPRSLWDPTYVEDSWIADYLGGEPIALIPRLRDEITVHNAGMGTAVTEWNYGGGGDVSGAIATADTLGIFGREGVAAATLWPQFSPQEDFTLGAFQMFGNYDGRGSRFGDTVLPASTTDRAGTSVYASVDSRVPGRTVIIAINKAGTPTSARLDVEGMSTGRADVYTLTASSSIPAAAPALTASAASSFSYTMPAQSVSVIVPTPARPTPAFTAGTPGDAVRGQSYSYTFSATGTPAPTYAIARGAVPAGMALDSSSGVLSGIPRETGTARFAVRASNGVGLGAITPDLTLTVSDPEIPDLTAVTPPSRARWQVAYSYRFRATGRPEPRFAVHSGRLPAGLRLDAQTGILAGRPTETGRARFSIEASNGFGVTVSPPITVTVPPLASGTVLSWGSDSQHQLGPGDTSTALPAPVTLPAGVAVTALAAGTDHSLALGSDGAVYGWGDNRCGELGDGHDSGCNAPLASETATRPVFPAGTPRAVAIAAGAQDSMALTADGNVWTWGNDVLGQLGDGGAAAWQPRPVPVPLGRYAGQIVAIAANAYSDLALTSSGEVLTWGDNTSGALGDGTLTNRSRPGRVQLGRYSGTIAAIAAGGSQAGHCLALTKDGRVLSWGFNNVGQLGTGSRTDSRIPRPVSGSLPRISVIGAGSYHSFAVSADGRTFAWGDAAFGQLGTGHSGEDGHHVETRPVLAGGAGPLISVTGGDFFSAAVDANGRVLTFGANGAGQLGAGTRGPGVTVPTPASLPPGTTPRSVATGPDFVLVAVR